MNQSTVIAFIQRIIKSGNPQQSALALQQLAEILRTQGDLMFAKLAENAADSVSELRSLPWNAVITPEEIRIAHQRAEDRRRYEEEAQRRGRC